MRRVPPSLKLINYAMKKEHDLETALTRNHRWIVNNQIKNIMLRFPNQVTPVSFIQKKFQTLDMQGLALNWLKKCPSCFEVFRENHVNYCRLTKRIMDIVEEENLVKEAQEPVFVERLAKVLMMTTRRKLNVLKLDKLKRNFGFPDDYLIRIVPKYPHMFRLVKRNGKYSSVHVKLISWNPELAVSQIEESARKQNTKPCFSCSLPLSWVSAHEKFERFNSTPYISPYTGSYGFEGSTEHDKRAIALVHELLSLSLWKKLSVNKLAAFKKDFALPDELKVLLLKHPCMFYVTNKYNILTVVLREAYSGSNLIQKDPLVVVKNKFGEVMLERRRETIQRDRLLNLENRKIMDIKLRKVMNKKVKKPEMSKEESRAGQVGGIFDPEERKRFYKTLFDEDS